MSWKQRAESFYQLSALNYQLFFFHGWLGNFIGSGFGGAFNPAIATGITVLHIEKAANFWLYLAGDFAGGALAALSFKIINPEDR